MLQQSVFEKHFTLEEAVRMLPFVKTTLKEAYQELSELKDEIVLYKRMHQLHEEDALDDLATDLEPASKQLQEVLNYKWHIYEETFHRWVAALSDKGIQVRDFRKGLIDFPYQAKDGTEYLLCWHTGEEGLFYFHDLYEGFQGRKPISLLPE